MANGLKAFFALTHYLNKYRKDPNFINSNRYFLSRLEINGEDKYFSTISDVEFEEEVEYTIVGSAEADPMNFKISNESPVGSALIGKKVGDVVEVAVPSGVSKFEILEIRRD